MGTLYHIGRPPSKYFLTQKMGVSVALVFHKYILLTEKFGQKNDIHDILVITKMYILETWTLVSESVKFKHIDFTSIEQQVLTTYTNLCRFCFFGTVPVLPPNVGANENP